MVATPNAETYSAANEHHEREYDAKELQEVLSCAFTTVEVFGLHAPLDLAARPEVRGSEFAVRADAVRQAEGLGSEWLVEDGSEAFDWNTITERSFPISSKSLDTSLDLLAYCRKT